MTVRREERLTVESRDDDALSIVQAVSEIPAGARLIEVELGAECENAMGHRYGTRPVTFIFKGVADA